MSGKSKLPFLSIMLASMLLMPGCHKKSPVANMPGEGFHLPAHFEVRLDSNESIMIPVGSSGLVFIKTLYNNAGVIHDLRPLQSVIEISELPNGAKARIMQQFSSIKKVPAGIEAVNVVRIDLLDMAIGQRFQLSGTASLRETFSTEHILSTKAIDKTIVAVAYEPDMEMVKKDRDAGLFYIESALRQYDQLTKQEIEVPWEPGEIEAKLDSIDPHEASGIMQLWKARVRAEEARRHLNIATNYSDSEVASYAKQALEEIDEAFKYWKDKGVGKKKKEKHVDQLWAEDKLDRRYAPIDLPTEKPFTANINIPETSRTWLTPIAMGLQLDSRFGGIGSSTRRSTALTETLTGELAIHDYFWIGARLPMYSMHSRAEGAKWTTGLLNPTVTVGSGYILPEHWRVRLEVEFTPNIGQSEDMFFFEYFLSENPGAATNAHSLSINPSAEFAVSQFTFSVLTGVQLAIGGDDGINAWFRYAAVAGVWLHQRFALQLDWRGRVLLTGDKHTAYGAFGFGGLINISKNWDLELGVASPYGAASRYSTAQFYINISCARWGTLAGKMKHKKSN